MDWKDTMMGYEELAKKIGYHSFTPKEGREAQAEISFKAGRQEVVGYKSKSLMEYHDKYCEKDKVIILVIPQAQLKVWGITASE